ncbi:Endonuclease [Citrus sinensis]|uniref:Endonuclease n=1 Tax=Citrus sinensis TaxID=2711 RepID=A0ACB8L7B7_CITSI|nr:Endonuclease [Citrus sinensis]
MLNPKVLPPDYWKNHTEYFRAANGKFFETSLITKKSIGIQFFPNCIIWQKIIGSDLPDKDLLIGFDILQLVKNLFITPIGIKFKQMFIPYTDVLRLYTLSDTTPSYTSISQKFLELYPENHSQFTHPSPLWKNEQFFIHLPFKLNEDVNPTKVTHPGMPPSDLSLAKQECTQLLQQGLIEPTTSDWACQAFYIEKRSKLVRGKKRLVIDYQPLNDVFLKDDKFPLPKIQSLFIHLQEDRPKTALCIPDAHFQWTVLPFSLKVAPSLFKKAMVKIFSPILHHALIYIDDILLFSHNHQTYQQLLSDFLEIVQTHGIMLSEKKSNIGKESIDFLGMVLKDGHYHPGSHIAAELLKFPDTDLNKKQIQQFLGIVNYIRDFIPKVTTEAIKQLKKIAQSPPPLRIPTTGQRILQTDASDDFWSAILLEKIGDSESYCAHASGQFKDLEKNYHVIYKEILAVKYGIKKFEFHLISHNFLIRMDNSSFPKIFDFKNKLLLDKQLLNLKTWFAKYDFTVQHIKGDKNLIPDFLTRPSIKSHVLISSITTIPIIAMNLSLPFKALTQKAFPLNLNFRSAF